MEAFLSAHEDPVGRGLLEQMHMERFVTIEDSAFDSVRDMAKWVEAQEGP